MHYEINISLNGQHYFATAARSLRSEDKAREVYDKLKQSFPADLGYAISVTLEKQSGKHVDFESEK